MIVIAAAPLHPESFRHRDLHMVDVTPVPDGFEDAVCEAEYQDVLDGFFPQIMIDAIDLPLFQHLSDIAVQRSCAIPDRCPNGFSIMTRRQCPFSSAVKTLFAYLADDFGEKLRQRREVIKDVAVGMVLRSSSSAILSLSFT